MKQILSRMLLLLVVIAAIFGLSSCKIFVEQEPSTYDLVVNDFERSVVYGSELDLSGLDIEVTTAGKVKYVAVTRDMITSGGKTDSVGDQEVVIEYGGFSWTLYYEVFYKIDHIVDGFVYDSQMVMSRDELLLVKDPRKENSIFIGWNQQIPDTLTGNLRIEAMFADGLTLPELAATYGDTLADLELPEAKDGHWEWKDSLDTSVGNAGTNKFTITFIPDNPAANRLEFVVDVAVAKKKLEFTILNDEFEYDGKQHSIDYELSDGVDPSKVNVVCFGTEYASDIGIYNYNLRIFDQNYEGQIKGSFEITKIKLTVDVLLQDGDSYDSDVTITYGDPFPDYKVTIKDKNGNDYVLGEALEVSVDKPSMLIAGYYDILATIKDVTNDNNNDLRYYDITYNVAKLVVAGVDFDPGPPLLKENYDIYYGDLLSSIEFADHPNGVWVWDYNYNASAVADSVGNAGKNTFRAEFIPKDSSYNKSEAYIVLDVNKKVLTINVDPASTTVVYDGKEHGLSYVVVDSATGKVFDDLIVTGDVKYVEAYENGYNITLSIDDANYTGSLSTTLKIKKADPVTDFSEVITLTWYSNLKLENIPLDAGYEWKYKNTIIDVAGEYIFDVVFTPEDTDNYNVINGKVKVIVEKAQSSITGFAEKYDSWTYNGSDFELNKTFFGYESVGGTVKYLYNGTEITSLKNAGEYLIKMVIAENDNYLGCEVSTTVIINKADPQITQLNITGWTYGDDSNDPSAKTTFGDIVYKYYIKSGEGYVIFGKDGLTAPTEAGTYYVHATVAATNDWNGAESIYKEFKIDKQIVELPEIENIVYQGKLVKPTVPESDLYSVAENGNEGGENVGEYKVTLVLADSDNYRWEGLSSATATVKYKITKYNSNVIKDFDGGEWTYEDTVSHSTKAIFGDVRYTYYVKNANGEYEKVDEAKNAGEYKVEARVAETDNYNGYSIEKTFVIAKKSVDIPELNDDQLSFVYTSKTITSGFKAPEGAYYKASDLGGKEVGDYYVTLTLNAPSNYEWDDNKGGAERKLKYSIVKDEVSITKLTIVGWKYKGTINTPTVEIDKTYTSPDLAYQYKTPEGEWIDTTITRNSVAGTYRVVATVADTTNYDGDVEILEFNIGKADNATINNIIAGKKYTTIYNKDTSYSIPGLSGSHNESTLTYTITKDGVSVTEMKNAGTYTVVITLPESDNYEAVYETVTVEIDEKVISKPTLSSVSKYYSGGVFVPTPSSSEDYEHEFENNSSIAAGTYKVTFTLTDTNYVWDPNIVWESGIPGVLTYTIQKANIGIEGNTSNRNNVPYTLAGYTLADIVAKGVNVESTLIPTITLDGAEVDEITGVGLYTVTYNYYDTTGNYNDRKVEFTVNITKATNKFTTNPAGGKSWTYGNIVDTTVFGAKASFGEVKYRFFTDAEGNSPLEVTSETRLGYGTYYVQAYVEDNSENYDDCESSIVAFNITKGTATISGAISSATSVYGQYAETTKDQLVANSSVTLAYGSAVKPEVTIMFTPVIGGTATPADTIYNAGTYVVTYSYSDNNHNSVTETATVNISPKTFSEAVTVYATYDDKLSSVELPEVEGGRLEWHNGENKVGPVGNQKWLARFVADNSGNYADVENVSVTVVVSTKFITKPEWEMNQTFDYDSITSHSAVINNRVDDAYYDITGNGNVAANEDGYTVTITLKSSHGDNIKWVDGTGEPLSFEYYVMKASTSIAIEGFAQNSNNTYATDLGKYDPTRTYTIPAGTVALKDGTTATAGYTVKYIPNVGDTVEDFKGDIKAAGTYIITYTYAGDNNHSASNNATLTVTIGKADSSVVITPVTGDSIGNNTITVDEYDGKNHLPTVTINGIITNYSADTYVYAKPEGFGGAVTEIVGETAGTYTLVYSLTNDNNYADISETVTLVIAQVKNNDTITIAADARYDDKVLNKIVLPENENGSWVLEGVDTNTTFITIGKNTFKAIFTSDDVNFADRVEDGIEITVGKKLVPEPNVDDIAYTGDLIYPDLSKIEGPFTVTANAGGTDHNTTAKQYFVEFTLESPETHEWSKASDSNSDIDGAKIKVYYDITNIVNKWKDGQNLAIEGNKWTYNFGETIPVPTAMPNEGTPYIQFRIKGTDTWTDWAYYDLTTSKWITTGNAPVDNGTYEIRAIVYADNDKEFDEANGGKGNNYDRLVSATQDLVINKATVTINGITIVGGTDFEYDRYVAWNTNTLLNGVSLTSDVTGGTVEGTVSVNVKYVPVIGNTVENYSGDIKNAGTYTIVYTFDGTNTNYVTETETIVITIKQSAASINGANDSREYSHVYDSDEYVVPGITPSHNEGTLVPTVTKDGASATIRTVGTYKVTYTLAETNNYYAATPVEVTVTITPASATITALDKEFEYNGTAYDTNEKLHALIGTSVTGIIAGDPTTLTYTVSDNKTIENHGTYTVTIVLDDPNYGVWNAETETYDKVTETVTVNVLKKDVSIEGINEGDTVTKVYHGAEGYNLSEIIGAYFVGVNGNETAGILYNGEANLNLANANENGYEVTISLDNNNYEATSITVKVVIEKAEATISLGSGVVNNTVTKTYEVGTSYDLATLIGASASYNGQPVSSIKYYVNGVETESLSEVNEDGYTVTVMLDNPNYKATSTVTFVIERISLVVPEVTGEYIYTVENGVAKVQDLIFTSAYDVFKDLKLANGTSLVSVSGHEESQAGENYNVVFTLNDTAHYKWVGVEGATATAPYSIGKATPVITVNGVTANNENKIALTSREYGAAGYAVLPEVEVNGVSVGNLSGTVTDAGSYSFTYTAEETDNYGERTVTVTLEITKAIADHVSITATGWTNAGDEFGSAITYPTVIVKVNDLTLDASKYTVYYSTSKTEDADWSEDKPTYAGTYYVKVEVAEDATNYFGAAKIFDESFEITQKPTEIKITGTGIEGSNGIYTCNFGSYTGGTYTVPTGTVDLANGGYATVTYSNVKYVEIDGTVHDNFTGDIKAAGTYVITYSYTDSEKNHADSTATLTVTIGQASLSYSGETSIERTYGNEGWKDIASSITLNGVNNETRTADKISTTVSITGADTYEVTYKFNGDNDYAASENIVITITVSPRSATIIAGGKTPTYNGNAYDTNDKLHALIGASISGIIAGDSIDLTYTVSDNKTIENHGTYTVTIVLDDPNYGVWNAETETYDKVTKTVTVNVLKKEVSIVGIDNNATVTTDKSGNTLVYRGLEGYAIEDIIGAYFVGVNGDEIKTGIRYNGNENLNLANANESGYEVTITLVHDNYYAEDKIVTFIIKQKATSFTVNDTEVGEGNEITLASRDYDPDGYADPLTVKVNGASFTETPTIKYKAPDASTWKDVTEITDAGTYVFTYVYNDTNGNYTNETLVVTLTVDPIDSSVEVISAAGNKILDNTITVGYNGDNHLPTVTINGIKVDPSISYTPAVEGFNATGDGINSGVYTLTYEFAGDTNHNPIEVTVTLTITRLTDNIVEILHSNDDNNTDDEWIYGETLDYYVADGTKIKYYSGTYDEESDKIVYSETEYNVPSNGFFVVGYYKAVAQIAETVNYPAGVATKEFTVSAKTLSASDIDGVLETTTTTYGQYEEVAYDTVIGAKLQLVDGTLIDLEDYITFTYNGNAHDGSIYNAGTYVITYSLSGVWNALDDDVKSNYYVANAENTTVTVMITIQQATPTITTLPVYNKDLLYQNIYFNCDPDDSDKEYELPLECLTTYPVATCGAMDVEGKWYYKGLNGSGVEYNYTLIFVPDDQVNYKAVDPVEDCSVTFKTVATIGHGGTPYGTIENALEKAGSGDTVWVIPDKTGNVIIKRDVAINSGVTLVLPYDDSSSGRNSDGKSDGKRTTSIARPESSYTQTKVVIDDKVTINVYGTLEVNGVLSGGGGGRYAGATTGNHAVIVTKDSAKIICQSGGTIKSSGYIIPEYSDGYVPSKEKPNILVCSGGKVYQPYIVRDYTDGNYFYAVGGGKYEGKSVLTDWHMTPFNEWHIYNIQSFMRIDHGGKLSVWANLDTSLGSQHADAIFIGSSNDDFLKIGTGGFVTTWIKDANDEVMHVDLYGGASIGKFVLTVTGIPASTEHSFFPFCWSLNVTLHNGTYDLGSQRFKIMWGGKLTVESDATLDASNTSIVVYNADNMAALNYEKANQKISVTTWRYTIESGKTDNKFRADGQLIINGTLKAGAIGGKVTSTANGTVEVTTPSATSYESVCYTRNYFSSTIDKIYGISNQLMLVNEDGTSFAVLSGTTAKYEDNAFWRVPKITVNFNSNGGAEYSSITSNYTDGGYGSVTLPTPTRPGYTFRGWYVDEDCTIAAIMDGTTFKNPTGTVTTLYAKWEKNTYTVNFDHNIEGPSVNPITFTITDGKVVLSTPADYGVYKFAGWYYGETKIESGLSVEAFVAATGMSLNGNSNLSTTLTGRWQSIVFTIVYRNHNDGSALANSDGNNYAAWTDGLLTSGDKDAVSSDSFVLPSYMITNYCDSDETYQFYFTSFTFSDGTKTFNTLADLKADVSAATASKSYYITANWTQKAALSIIVSGSNSEFASYNTDNTSNPEVVYVVVGSQYSVALANVRANNSDTQKTIYSSGWEASGCTIGEDFKVTVTELTASVKVTWKAKKLLTIDAQTSSSGGADSSIKSLTYTIRFYDETKTEVGSDTKSGTKDDAKYYIPDTYYYKFDEGYKVYKFGNDSFPTDYAQLTADKTYIAYYYYKGCVTGDTLVTLADGTKKRIDEVTSEDILMVWNFFEGKLDYVPAAIIFDHGFGDNTVIKLMFSDGTIVKVVNLHQFYDADLMTFVNIDKDTVGDYVGHEFAKKSGECMTAVTLVDYEVSYEHIEAYGIISALHYNIFVEDMLSTDFMPEDYDLFNYFEFDENLRFDEAKMKADIEEYGLYTYEDFAEYLTYEQFVGFNVQYFKIAVGKGNYTYEGIIDLINEYLKQ